MLYYLCLTGGEILVLKMMNYKMKKNSLVIMYTGVFALCTILILLIFCIRGNSFVWSADALNQYYPVLEYIRRYVKALFFQGEFQQFDLSIGLGEGIIPTLNYYGFGNLFTLLLLFVPDGGTVFFYGILIFLHIYLSGISFLYWCKCMNYQNKKVVIMAASFYAFSAFSLVQGLEFWTFLTPMVTLPLVASGVRNVFEKSEKKVSKYVMIAAIFFQSLNGFYFLYMITLFIFIYFLICCFCEEISLKKSLRLGIKLFFQCALGVCMAGVILVPAILGYLQSARMMKSKENGLFYSWESYLNFIKNLFIPRAFETGIGLPIPFLLACCLVPFQKKVKVHTKILLLFWMAGFVTPLLGRVMNGFSYSTTRWQFILYFVFAVVFVEVFTGSLIIKAGSIFIYLVIVCVSLFLHIMSTDRAVSDIIRIIVYGGMSLFPVFLLLRKDKQKRWGTVYCIMLLLLNICMLFGPTSLGGSGFRAGFKTYRELKDGVSQSVANEIKGDKGLYRLDVRDFSLGASLLLDYNGISEYFSIGNRHVYDFYSQFMISPGMSSTWTFYGLDSRSVLEDLLAVRYFTEYKWNGEEYVSQLVKNGIKGHLGVLYTDYILESDFNNLDPINKMDIVRNNVLLEKKPENIEVSQAEIIVEDYEIPYAIECSNIIRKDKHYYVNENSNIIISPKVGEETEGEIYVYLNNLKRYGTPERKQSLNTIQIGNKTIDILDCEFSQINGINIWEYMIHANYLDKISDNIEISFQEEDIFEFQDLKVYLYNPYSKGVTWVEDSQKINIEENKGNIDGYIQTDKDGMLFLCVPYSKGWNAWVDGEKIDILKANIGFMAIPVKKGEHIIKLRYVTPGICFGIFLSVIGMGGLLVYGIYNRKKNRNKDE